MSSVHPSTLFATSSSIEKGVPLKDIFNVSYFRLLNTDLRVWSEEEISDLTTQLKAHTLIGRANLIATSLLSKLTLSQLQSKLGPELSATANNGLQPFYYFPHAMYLRQVSLSSPAEELLSFGKELTKRFTVEFSFRDRINADPAFIKLLLPWCSDPNPHVRRAATEATRPALPWATKLVPVSKNPQLTEDIRNALFNDSSRYVTRSVSNHMGDILKSNPSYGYTWRNNLLSKDTSKETLWLVRHAIRHPLKSNTVQALAILDKLREHKTLLK